MTDFERLAHAIRVGEPILGSVRIKESRVRIVARVEDAFLKVFLKPGKSRHEARALLQARRRGLPVPELLGAGTDWIATRWIDATPAGREDLGDILEVVETMHDSGMLHRDLHLGNLLRTDAGIVLTDLQRATFLPWIPGILRRREIGWLSFSLGEPLPRELEGVRFWRDLRAQTHWRSRTKRCLKESGSFTRFSLGTTAGFRRRDVNESALVEALDPATPREGLKSEPSGTLYRSGPFILKKYRTIPEARRAWINGRGLEARGIETALATAWVGPWLVMQDAGSTVSDFVDEGGFVSADERARLDLADRLADLLAALHRRGIYHADLKANNVTWTPGSAPKLLDYDRVRFRWRISTARRIKNLAQLNASLPDAVDGALRERAFERYLGASEFSGDPARLRTRVIRLSLRRSHRWRGC